MCAIFQRPINACMHPCLAGVAIYPRECGPEVEPGQWIHELCTADTMRESQGGVHGLQAA
eukprot:365870-Chlamydomonas_euryale.AAC.7